MGLFNETQNTYNFWNRSFEHQESVSARLEILIFSFHFSNIIQVLIIIDKLNELILDFASIL